MSEHTTCQACHKPVIFADDEKGTRQILDLATPVYRIDATTDPEHPQAAVRVLKFYVSHFSVCPDADHFSRSKKCACGHARKDHPLASCAHNFCVCPQFYEQRRKA